MEKSDIEFDDIVSLNNKDGELIHDSFVEINYYAKKASKAHKNGQERPTLIFVYYSGHGRVENEKTLKLIAH